MSRPFWRKLLGGEEVEKTLSLFLVNVDPAFVRGLALRRKITTNDVKIVGLGRGTKLEPLSPRGERFARDLNETLAIGTGRKDRRSP